MFIDVSVSTPEYREVGETVERNRRGRVSSLDGQGETAETVENGRESRRDENPGGRLPQASPAVLRPAGSRLGQ